MLEGYIIEELRRRERQRQEERREQPFLELPLPEPIPKKREEEGAKNRVVEISLYDEEEPKDRFEVNFEIDGYKM